MSAATILGECVLRVQSDVQAWTAVEDAARSIADELKTSSSPADTRTVLGATQVIAHIAALINIAVPSKCKPPEDAVLSAVFQLLRVAANVCADHNDNRSRALDAEIPQLVIRLLESYLTKCEALPSVVPPLTVPHLNVVRTAIGVLINTSYEFKSVRTKVLELGVVKTVLQIHNSFYLPGSWRTGVELPSHSIEEWQLRQGIVAWIWQLLQELKEKQAEDEKPVFTEHELPEPIACITSLASASSKGTATPLSITRSTRESFEATDLDILEECSMLVETLALDLENARFRLGRNDLLQPLVDFIENADYPGECEGVALTDQQTYRKHFDMCKGALITALTAVAGDDRNADALWNEPGETDMDVPKHWFPKLMFQWIKQNTIKIQTSQPYRDDLIIAGTLSLGNLARRDSRSIQLTKDPINVVPHIQVLLHKDIGIKVKNGAIGLLKTLCQPLANRPLLGAAHFPRRMADSGVWEKVNDMAEVVQGIAIGAVKHLCAGNASNCVDVVTDTETSASCLAQILALVKRSDTTAIKSEGTRVLVNVIKTLCVTEKSEETLSTEAKAAVQYVLLPEQCLFLAQLLGRSLKYPVLLNESIVSMTLAALHGKTEVILSNLLAPLPKDIPLENKFSNENYSPASSSSGSPHTALDVLNMILASKDNKFPSELRINACSLVLAVFRDSGSISSNQAHNRQVGGDLLKVTLQEILEDSDSPSASSEDALKESVKHALAVL